MIHDGDAVAQTLGFFHVMRGVDDRRAFAAQRLVPQGSVLAVEPYGPCFERLAENVGHYQHVVAALAGAGAEIVQ